MIKKEKIKDQLEDLRNVLLQNKEKIQSKEISYENIQTILKETFQLKISKKTIKSYCKKHLYLK